MPVFGIHVRSSFDQQFDDVHAAAGPRSQRTSARSCRIGSKHSHRRRDPASGGRLWGRPNSRALECHSVGLLIGNSCRQQFKAFRRIAMSRPSPSPVSAVALASAPRSRSSLTMAASPPVRASSSGEDSAAGLALGLGLAPLSSKRLYNRLGPGSPGRNHQRRANDRPTLHSCRRRVRRAVAFFRGSARPTSVPVALSSLRLFGSAPSFRSLASVSVFA